MEGRCRFLGKRGKYCECHDIQEILYSTSAFFVLLASWKFKRGVFFSEKTQSINE